MVVVHGSLSQSINFHNYPQGTMQMRNFAIAMTISYTSVQTCQAILLYRTTPTIEGYLALHDSTNKRNYTHLGPLKYLSCSQLQQVCTLHSRGLHFEVIVTYEPNLLRLIWISHSLCHLFFKSKRGLCPFRCLSSLESPTFECNSNSFATTHSGLPTTFL